MPILNLEEYFGVKDKATLVKTIKANAGKGAGKSLSTTLELKPDEMKSKEDKTYARVKLSNFYAWYRRGLWGVGIDPNRADTIAEHIGSRMARAVSDPARDGYSSAPEVDLFVDAKGAFGLVSRYVKGVRGSLDDVHTDLYIEKHKLLKGSKVPQHKGHALISCASSLDGVGIDPNNPKAIVFGGYLKKELYDRIALRAMMGDHDGNPGNYLIVKDGEGRDHVAGIDYGHAFNDMVKSLNDGSKVGKHGMLDYLNRGMLNGGQNKLHRNFIGHVPDPDFAAALRNASSEENVRKMTDAASKAIGEIKELKDKKVSEKRLIDTVKTLCARMGEPVQKKDGVSLDELTKKLEDVVIKFTEKNAAESRSVANLIEIQAEVDRALIKGEKIDISKISAIYKQDEQYLKGKEFGDKIEWAKNDQDKSAKKCSLADYVASRAKQLGKGGAIINKEYIADFKATIKKADKGNKVTASNEVENIPDGPIPEQVKRGLLDRFKDFLRSTAKDQKGSDRHLAEKAARTIEVESGLGKIADVILAATIEAVRTTPAPMAGLKVSITLALKAFQSLFKDGANKETKAAMAAAAAEISSKATKARSV